MTKDRYNRELNTGDTILFIGEKPYWSSAVWNIKGNIVTLNHNNRIYNIASYNTIRINDTKDVSELPDEFQKEIRVQQIFVKFRE